MAGNELEALFEVSGGARAGRAIPNLVAVRYVRGVIGY